MKMSTMALRLSNSFVYIAAYSTDYAVEKK